MVSRLKIVATPIGNTRDISLRALDELKHADVIFAEDTRHSLKLIQALGLELKPECRLISCDSHKETQRISVIVERLRANDRIVLISDAGCPTISDPGSLLVQGVIAAGCDIEIIPGPSAHSAAIMGAGIDTTRFAFLGFLPQKKIARENLIVSSAQAGLALIFYESPLRVSALLRELFELLGERRIVIAREITKFYETFHRGTLGAELNPPFVEMGECVVVVEGGEFIAPVRTKTDEHDVTKAIDEALKNGDSAKDIARMIAERFKMKKKSAYNLVLSQTKKGEP